MSAAAVVYCRVSSDEQAASGLGLADQEARARAYAAMRGLEVADVIVDAGVSGGTPLAEREGGARVLELTGGRRPRVAHVIVLKLDRCFRNAADCLAVTASWDKRGVALHILDLGGASIETRSATGRFMLTVLAGAAEMERNLACERTKAALAVKRRRGEFTGGGSPYGYSIEGGRLVPVAAEQEVLTAARELRAAGWSFRSIARELAARGKRARGGRPFEASQVSRMCEECAA